MSVALPYGRASDTIPLFDLLRVKLTTVDAQNHFRYSTAGVFDEHDLSIMIRIEKLSFGFS